MFGYIPIFCTNVETTKAESREALVLALTAIHDDSVVSQLCAPKG